MIKRKAFLVGLFIALFVTGMGSEVFARYSNIERTILSKINTHQNHSDDMSKLCKNEDKYVIYLIDNFNQPVDLIPEIEVTHGELLFKILSSGRQDFEIKTLNTSLSQGLAIAIQDLENGKCIDAIISSTPGSNYTYGQLNSLLLDQFDLNPGNISTHKEIVLALLRKIAYSGFPSVNWLERIDANPNKLRNDARLVAFIEHLGQFEVPVFLPYGNDDTYHKGQIRNINILSFVSNARVYSALDKKGNRIPGFPYSSLSTGDEQALYDLRECPHPDNPQMASLDINNDGYFDFSYQRKGKIAYRAENSQIKFAPPVLSEQDFGLVIEKIKNENLCIIGKEVVLTARQYRKLKAQCTDEYPPINSKQYVWWNSDENQPKLFFDAHCWVRGQISGTSLIPPNKVKEFLP